MNKPDLPTPSITDAPIAHSDDISSRMKSYILSMSIRVLCFVCAFFCQGPFQWVMFTLAIILPYFAVLFANAGRKNPSSKAHFFSSDHKNLES